MSNPKKGANGLYTVTVTVEEDGKKVRKFFRGKTAAEAKKKMMAYQKKQEAGRTFGEVADAWEAYHWKRIKPGTQVSYRPALKRAADTFGKIPIRQIRPLDVQHSVTMMADDDYAHHSVVIYRSVLNQIFDYAVLHGDIEINPTLTVKIPKGLKSNRRECPEQDVLDTIDANVSHPHGLFPFFLRWTGLRRGELLALQWKDIDFEQHRISISKSVSYADGNKAQVTTPKTEAGVRPVIMVNRLVEQLKPLAGKPEEYVFGGAKPYTENEFNSRWRRYCIDVGLFKEKIVFRYDGRKKKNVPRTIKVPTLTPHQLRHAYATMCYELGIDPKDTQHQLGHSKLEVTMDTYTHASKRRELEVERKLNLA